MRISVSIYYKNKAQGSRAQGARRRANVKVVYG